MNEVSTIAVVDDDGAVRASLTGLLETLGYRVRAYASGQELLADRDLQSLHCLLLDMHMPGLSGTETRNRLDEWGIVLPTVYLTAHGDIPMAVEAMRRGAIDFLQKPYQLTALIEAIRRAVRSCGAQRDSLARRAERAQKLARLSPREKEVLALLAQGLGNKAVANALGIAVKTAEDHRAAVQR
ncbi:MAG: response regulator transcription factor, partial [Burkholderiales bacterium]